MSRSYSRAVPSNRRASSAPAPLQLSRHACARAAQRNVAPDAVAYVLAHGRIMQRTGVTFCFLGRRDIPPMDRGASWAARLVGTVVLMARDGGVITMYRDRRALRTIARKMKYRLAGTGAVRAGDSSMEEWHQASA